MNGNQSALGVKKGLGSALGRTSQTRGGRTFQMTHKNRALKWSSYRWWLAVVLNQISGSPTPMMMQRRSFYHKEPLSNSHRHRVWILRTEIHMKKNSPRRFGYRSTCLRYTRPSFQTLLLNLYSIPPLSPYRVPAAFLAYTHLYQAPPLHRQRYSFLDPQNRIAIKQCYFSSNFIKKQ